MTIKSTSKMLHILLLCALYELASSSPLSVAGFAHSSIPVSSSGQKATPRSSHLHEDDSCSWHSQRLIRQRQHTISKDRQLCTYPYQGIGRTMAADAISSDTRVPSVSGGQSESEYIWDVFVSQSSNKNKEKGVIPTSSITQAFTSLAPSADAVRTYPVIFNKQNKQKGKGHTVRCIQRKRTARGSESKNNNEDIVSALEIGNVDSVDKVYRIMTEHMKLGEINPKACECMKCYFQGNQSLEDGESSNAIALYNRALSAAKKQPLSQLPKGSILMKRASAYLKRAAKHRSILRTLVKDLTDTVPSASTMKILYQTASSHSALSSSIFQRLAGDSKLNTAKFRQIRYRHDMYEFALLHAVQDSLQSTQLLPKNAKAWLLAGECLAELRKLKESNQYYERALEIDPSMEQTLKGVMDKNRVSQEFMDAARASGFSGDTLRLALDVAA